MDWGLGAVCRSSNNDEASLPKEEGNCDGDSGGGGTFDGPAESPGVPGGSSSLRKVELELTALRNLSTVTTVWYRVSDGGNEVRFNEMAALRRLRTRIGEAI